MNQSINHKFVFVGSIDCNSYTNERLNHKYLYTDSYNSIVFLLVLNPAVRSIGIYHAHFTDYFWTRLFAGNLNWHFSQLITFLVVTDLSNICMNTKIQPISRKSRRNQTYTTTGQISRDVSHHCMQPRQVGGEVLLQHFKELHSHPDKGIVRENY